MKEKELLDLLVQHSYMLDSLREYLEDLGVPEQKHLLDFDKYLVKAIRILQGGDKMLTKIGNNYYYDGVLLGSKKSIPYFYKDYVKNKVRYDFRLYIMLEQNKNCVPLYALYNYIGPIDDVIIDGESFPYDTTIDVHIDNIETKLNTEDYPGPQVETIFIGRRI